MRRYIVFILSMLMLLTMVGCFGNPLKKWKGRARHNPPNRYRMRPKKKKPSEVFVDNPSEAILHYRYGTEYFVQGRYLEAKESFQKST